MYWYVLAHAVIPIPLLLFAWYRRLSYAPPSPRKGFLLLLLAPTASDAWFFLATKYPNAIGDSYSNLRYVVIELNLLACWHAQPWPCFQIPGVDCLWQLHQYCWRHSGCLS